MTADRAGRARAEGMREPPQGGRAPSLSPAVGRGGTDVSAFRRVRGVRTTRSIIASVSLSSPRAVPHSPGSISPMMASSLLSWRSKGMDDEVLLAERRTLWRSW